MVFGDVFVLIAFYYLRFIWIENTETGVVKSSGFGMFAPTTQESRKEDYEEVEEEEEDKEEEEGEFVTLNEIRSNKISREGKIMLHYTAPSSTYVFYTA